MNVKSVQETSNKIIICAVTFAVGAWIMMFIGVYLESYVFGKIRPHDVYMAIGSWVVCSPPLAIVQGIIFGIGLRRRVSREIQPKTKQKGIISLMGISTVYGAASYIIPYGIDKIFRDLVGGDVINFLGLILMIVLTIVFSQLLRFG